MFSYNKIKQFKHFSNIGKLKMIDVIYGNPTSGTYGDYLLLKEYYRLHDNEDDWRTKVLFSIKYLRKQKQISGDLMCAYCGKEHLKIHTPSSIQIPKSIKATIDHFIPISLGGGVLDENNIVVSCEKCNKKKQSKIYSIDKLKYASDKDINKIKNYIQKFKLNLNFIDK